MFFLNLTAGEFFALLGALGGVVTALYLLDRSKRRKVVSTLRFWPSAATADEQTSRKRMHQPWSLLLQLLSLTLLLLAIAQLQWGNRVGRSRDHVLLLDTSVWSGAKASGGGFVLDRERHLAERYLTALPSRDRIMLVRVDALPSPGTPFTSSREQILSALRESVSSVSALDLSQAFSFAKQALNWSGGSPGEIAYIGPERIGTDQPIEAVPNNLRVIPVPADGENAVIRNIGVKRGEETNSWEAVITLKNEGLSPRRLTLKTQFAGTRFAPRVYALRPGEEIPAKYNFVTDTAGRLLVELQSDDSLSSDNHAELQLPANKNFTIFAYTKRREVLQPLLEANHQLTIHYFDPFQYGTQSTADLILLDGFAPQQLPAVPSLWMNPPRESSPLPVKTVVKNAVIKTWHADMFPQMGLHTREDRIGEAEIFGSFEGAVPVASAAEGPVIVAISGGPSHPKSAIVGFDPFASSFRFSITTPLLFANLLHWLAPEAFRDVNFTADRVGAVAVPLSGDEKADHLRVSDNRGFAVPFTIREQTLQLFVNQPTVVHVASGDHYERILSLTLPDTGEGKWSPPANVPTGLPPAASPLPASLDLWKWLACLGGLGIFIEWQLFGRDLRAGLKRPRAAAVSDNKNTPSRERELVSR